MNAFHGPQGKGAMKRRREQKRREAEERNARTLPERRSRRFPTASSESR